MQNECYGRRQTPEEVKLAAQQGREVLERAHKIMEEVLKESNTTLIQRVDWVWPSKATQKGNE